MVSVMEFMTELHKHKSGAGKNILMFFWRAKILENFKNTNKHIYYWARQEY